MKPQLGVDLNGLRFPQPVLSASGCLATGHDVPGLVDLHKLGGVVTPEPHVRAVEGVGHTARVRDLVGVADGRGVPEPGRPRVPRGGPAEIAQGGVPVVGSVAGASLAEYVNVASALHLKPGVVALEVCVSCPDDEREGEPFYARPERLTEVVGAVARLSRVPVFAKLPPLLPGLVETAQACVRAGAFGLTLIDHVPALAVDPQRLRTRTATPVGGLSGPAIKPVALAAVYQVARALPDVPVMGVGGIATAEDAVEFLLAGAWAVQVGTALLVDPSVHVDIAQGILGYLREKGFASPDELRGRVRVPDMGNGSS